MGIKRKNPAASLAGHRDGVLTNKIRENMSTPETPKKQAKVPATMSQKLEWLKRVLGDPKLTPQSKNLATALFMSHNQLTGRCNPRQEVLAGMVGGVTRETVSRSIAKLEAAGWIKTVRTRGASYYVLALGDPAAVDDEASAQNDNETDPKCDATITPDVTLASQQMCVQRHMELSGLNRPSQPSSISPPTPSAIPDPGPAGPEEKRRASGRARSSEPRAPRGGGSPLPDDFALNDGLEAVMAEAGVPVADRRAVFEHFVAHAHDKGRTSFNWTAALATWCRTNTARREGREDASKPKKSRFQI